MKSMKEIPPRLSPLILSLVSGALLNACAHKDLSGGSRRRQSPRPERASASLLNGEISREISALGEAIRLKRTERTSAIPSASHTPGSAESAGSTEVLVTALSDENLQAKAQGKRKNEVPPGLPSTLPPIAPSRARAKDRERVPVLVNPEFATGEIATSADADVTIAKPTVKVKPESTARVGGTAAISPPAGDTPLVFELPVTYNDRVRSWVRYFQTSGRNGFRLWLERSARWIPFIEKKLIESGLPQDLVYLAMIESGFSPTAVSPANAVGMWQFIKPTGERYGLRADWWIDERRDVQKSTMAAIRYLSDLHKMFGSWYLVAASYNMGESGVQRLIKKHGSSDFWVLADRRALPSETTNYVPKILAAMLIAKAPALYGFRDLKPHSPHSFETLWVPGGTDLLDLATYLGVSGKYLQELNPELIRAHIPRGVRGHFIRIPKGAVATVAHYVKMQTSGGTQTY